MKSCFLLVLLLAGCASTSSRRSPTVTLEIPAVAQTELAVRHFASGENVVDRGFKKMTALAPMTRYEGFWGPRSHYRSEHSSWWLDIYAADSPRVAAAYLHAKGGYEANLDEWSNFILPVERTGPIQPLSYLFARFERKSFRWGDAVSFLSQGTQDTGIYVPCNNQFLTYEVWGVTADRRYTIVMHTAVKHPRLEECRDVRTMEALKEDPAYRLVEHCSADEFQPSLTEVDQMLNSVQVR